MDTGGHHYIRRVCGRVRPRTCLRTMCRCTDHYELLSTDHLFRYNTNCTRARSDPDRCYTIMQMSNVYLGDRKIRIRFRSRKKHFPPPPHTLYEVITTAGSNIDVLTTCHFFFFYIAFGKSSFVISNRISNLWFFFCGKICTVIS